MPVLLPTVGEVAKKNMPFIIKGNGIVLDRLKNIQNTVITNDEERTVAAESLAKTKAVCDRVDLLIKEVVDPLETFIDAVKSYKKSIDYNSKTKDGNEYTKARAVIEAYDQVKAAENEKARAAAEFLKQQNLFKAEIKEGVARRLVDMISGQKKNIIDGMSRWESALTLANIDGAFEKISIQKPSLKIEKYNECFAVNFSLSGKPMVPEVAAEYMESLKADYPYEKYNNEYVETVAPIINEYRAKKDVIKARLEEIQKAGEAERVRLEAARKAELEAKAQADLKVVNEQHAEAIENVEHQKEMDKMDAEFVEQVQTQDLDSGPMKRVASFESNEQFLKPFASVIGACALHPKFPGIMKKNGTDVIDSVQWWLDWYGANCKDPIKGIVVKEVPKTIIRKAK